MALRYWVGGGSSNNWTATSPTNWSATSGGTNNASVPGSSDDVIFDANSGSGASVKNTIFTIKSLDCTGYTGTISNDNNVNINGNKYYIKGWTQVTGNTNFNSTSGTTLITTNGITLRTVTFDGVGGTFQLQDDLTANVDATHIVTLTNGTLDLNNHTITTLKFSSSNSNTRKIKFGSGKIILQDTASSTVWDCSTSTGMTIDANTGTIEISGAGATHTFAGGGLDYNGVTLLLDDVTGSNLTISGANTFGSISITATAFAHTLKFPNTTTTTCTTFNVSGTSGHLVTISSGTNGTTATLSVASGTVSCDYLSMRDNTATGGASFYAGANSTNTSNNVGWTFTAPPSIPAIPAGLAAVAGNGSVALSWSAASGATTYNLKRSTTNGSGYSTIVNQAGLSYTDSTVTNGVTYYYVVSAVNVNGESNNSSQVSATPTGPVNTGALNPSKYQVQLRDRNGRLIKVLNNLITKTGISWEWNRIGGCGICNVVLAAKNDTLTNFGPDYDLQIWLEDKTGVAQLFYRGYAESMEPILQINDNINLSFSGYAGQLKRKRINRTYINMEISAIVKDILDTEIVPNTDITYKSSDIVGTSFAIDVLNFDCLGDVALQTLADIAGGIEWGVDMNQNFFFKPVNGDITRTLRIGREVVSSDPIYDYSTIINRIELKGGTVDNVPFNDTIDNTESQNAYGLRTSIISNSAIVTEGVSQQYGTQLLAEQARILLRSTITITKNKTLFESIIPLGGFSLLTTKVPQAKFYNDADAIYGAADGWTYGGRQSFQVERISYTLANEGTDVIITGGAQTPDIATQVKKLQYQIDQIRST